MKIYYALPLYLLILAMLAWAIQYSVAGLFQRELPFWPLYVALLVVSGVALIIVASTKITIRTSRW